MLTPCRLCGKLTPQQPCIECRTLEGKPKHKPLIHIDLRQPDQFTRDEREGADQADDYNRSGTAHARLWRIAKEW